MSRNTIQKRMRPISEWQLDLKIELKTKNRITFSKIIIKPDESLGTPSSHLGSRYNNR